MAKRAGGKAYYMISAVSQKYNIHPQTLRLYEREGLLKPSRTEGNTRLYSEDDLEQLETILSLTRDLGVNLAGVEIILNMRRKIEQMQSEVNEFMDYVKRELARGIDDWEQRLNTALVKSFVNVVTFFPLGSVVRTDRDEVGVVIRTNATEPLHPVIALMGGDYRRMSGEIDTSRRTGAGAYERHVVETLRPPQPLDLNEFLVAS